MGAVPAATGGSGDKALDVLTADTGGGWPWTNAVAQQHAPTAVALSHFTEPQHLQCQPGLDTHQALRR